MKETIKQLRKEADEVSQQLESICNDSTHTLIHIEKAVRSMRLAKAFLGKILGELGIDTPYKNDGNRHSIKDIEPTDSVVNIDEGGLVKTYNFNERNYIEKIDILRVYIHNMSKTIMDIKTSRTICAKMSYNNNIFTTKVYTDLCEARIHLGFELGRVRNSKE